MRHEYAISPKRLTEFLTVMNADQPWWELADEPFELAIKSQPARFVKAYGKAFAANELDDIHPRPGETGDSLIERKACAFYQRKYKRWQVGDQLQFNLPDGLAYIVTLTAIEPITPTLRPGRGRGELKYGWWVTWDPNAVSREARA